ncbi:hypothetical protein [Iningainema tapete]|uniref:Uncharacterized protein n=1 Tax=Iningainema tapete BLCC-T55 TaxID=2748662 RepID=A0A8J7BZI1_9CYAN|nr:hypothetical protein [Iningainema tapete]MBD2777722.1 hypothetical protein [Iningainema tapete BLCC-T55]
MDTDKRDSSVFIGVNLWFFTILALPKDEGRGYFTFLHPSLCLLNKLENEDEVLEKLLVSS